MISYSATPNPKYPVVGERVVIVNTQGSSYHPGSPEGYQWMLVEGVVYSLDHTNGKVLLKDVRRRYFKGGKIVGDRSRLKPPSLCLSVDITQFNCNIIRIRPADAAEVTE